MTRRLTIGALLVLSALLHTPAAAAQTATATALWTQPNALADAQSFTYTIKDGAAAAVTLSGVTCTASGTSSACKAPIAPLAPGVHSLVLTASSPLGSASSAPLTGTTPGAPTSVTITITVTVP